MSFDLITTAFDLFTSCYVFASLCLVLVLLIDHLVCSILSELQHHPVKTNPEPDFYQQVKDLLREQTIESEPDFSLLKSF